MSSHLQGSDENETGTVPDHPHCSTLAPPALVHGATLAVTIQALSPASDDDSANHEERANPASSFSSIACLVPEFKDLVIPQDCRDMLSRARA